MIEGIGVDLMEYATMERTLRRSGRRFIDRVFTPHEQRTCDGRNQPTVCLASRFAAKEALAKALRIGIFRLGMRNAEVRNHPDGAPYFVLHGPLAEQPLRIHLSLSDGADAAVAFVVVERLDHGR